LLDWEYCGNQIKDVRQRNRIDGIATTGGVDKGHRLVALPFHRRQANELPGAPSQEEAVIAFGKFKLNLGTREMFREDEPMPLTSGEFAVLKALVSHPREPLSRDKLMNLARGREYSAMERSIDVQISRLRRMVEEDPAHPRYIQTVWGLGYVFGPDGSKA
jgi:two-component system phosphate regulon response regulator OmpR